MKGHTSNEWSQGSSPGPSAQQPGLLLRPDSIVRGISGTWISLPGSSVSLLPAQALCCIIMGNFSLSTSCTGHGVGGSPGTQRNGRFSCWSQGLNSAWKTRNVSSLRQCLLPCVGHAYSMDPFFPHRSVKSFSSFRCEWPNGHLSVRPVQNVSPSLAAWWIFFCVTVICVTM